MLLLPILRFLMVDQIIVTNFGEIYLPIDPIGLSDCPSLPPYNFSSTVLQKYYYIGCAIPFQIIIRTMFTAVLSTLESNCHFER